MYPLSANGSLIVDAAGTPVQLRCANWPGHMETMLPEGLQYATVDDLVSLLVQSGVFNCIRLGYSVEMVASYSSLTARASFTRLNLSTHIEPFSKYNPSLIDAPVLAAFDAVIAACNEQNVMVLMDNTVSRASWCCSYTDGNGWWGDEYFLPHDWLVSLNTLAARYYNHTAYSNVIAFSLRNELRTNTMNRSQQINDWYQYVPSGIDAINSAHPDTLIFVSGLNYDCDWTFLKSSVSASASVARDLQDEKEWQYLFTVLQHKLVLEAHIYSWSGYAPITPDCTQILPAYDKAIGYALTVNRPLVISEFGLDQDAYPTNSADLNYMQCISRWFIQHELSWGVWLYGSTYYVRNNQANAHDGFGSTYSNFTGYKNPTFISALQKLIVHHSKEETDVIERESVSVRTSVRDDTQ